MEFDIWFTYRNDYYNQLSTPATSRTSFGECGGQSAFYVFLATFKSTVQYIPKLDVVLISEMLTMKQRTMINRHVYIFLYYASKLLQVLSGVVKMFSLSLCALETITPQLRCKIWLVFRGFILNIKNELHKESSWTLEKLRRGDEELSLQNMWRIVSLIFMPSSHFILAHAPQPC